MRIFLYELKKVFSPLRTLFIFLLIALFFAEFAASSFSWKTSLLPTPSYELKTLYSNELDETERKEAQPKVIEIYHGIVSEELKNDEWFLKNGILDYDGIKRLKEKDEITEMKKTGMSTEDILANGHKEYNPLSDYTLTDYEKNALERYMVLQRQNREIARAYTAIERTQTFFDEYDKLHNDKEYQNNVIDGLSDGKSTAAIERCREIFNGAELNSLLSVETTHGIFSSLPLGAAFFVLSLFALLSPLLTTDNMTGVRLLQYASKKGRPLLKSQYAAYLAASFLIMTVEIVLCAALFLSSNEGLFKDCLINSFREIREAAFWYVGTFGGYLLCLAGIAYILAPVAASVVFIVSHYNSKIISMLLKAIPIAAALAVFSYLIFNYAFALDAGWVSHSSLSQLIPVKYIEVYAVLLLLALSVAAAAVVLKRNRGKELHN